MSGDCNNIKQYYQLKGYRVHSGLQFGAELVLYAAQPDLVHSDFCIQVARDGKYFVTFHLFSRGKC